MSKEDWLITTILVLALLCFLAFFGGMFLALQSYDSHNETARQLDQIIALLLRILEWLYDLTG
jgi:uncharacterized membrane protein